jgi:hypothetical protein
MALSVARILGVLAASVLGILASAATLQLNPPGLLNTSFSLDAIDSKTNITALPPTTKECFNPPTPATFVLPALARDCYQIADKLLELHRGPRGKILTFGNKDGDDVRFPKIATYKTCRIEIGTSHESDEDKFDLWTLYGAGLSLAQRCTEGPVFRYGGIKTVGPKGVVNMLMTGRLPPPVSRTASAAAGIPDASSGARLLNGTQLDTILAVTNTTSSDAVAVSILALPDLPTTDGCFVAPTAKTAPLLPAEKNDCYKAADNLLDVVSRQARDVPLTFGRKRSGYSVDIQLPANSKYETCGIYIDVFSALNEDTFELWNLYGAALDLVSRCTTGRNRYGGRRTVGPKGVVDMWIGGRIPTPPSEVLTSAVSTNAPVVARGHVQSGILSLPDPSMPNSSSLEAVFIVNSTSISEYDDCFDPPAPRTGLYPTNLEDCSNAAQGLIQDREPFRPIIFARKGIAGYRLPKVVRNGTCVISIDVLNDNDKDTFTLWKAYTAAIDIARRCTQGPYTLGGRTTVGPKNVVNVVVFGRTWPPPVGTIEPAASGAALVEASAQPRNIVVALLNTPQPSSITSPEINITSIEQRLDLNTSSLYSNRSLGGIPECADPPMPRERAWPIEFEDCEQATYAIIRDRDRTLDYTFSRKPLTSKYYYPLPATFRYKTCVILLDTMSDQDEDTVRLAYVESTAWVLAHKCSGLEKSSEEYGGRVTVGVGAKDLINIWIYGRIWLPPIEGSNSTALLLDSE